MSIPYSQKLVSSLEKATSDLTSLYRANKPEFAALVGGCVGTLAILRAAWIDYKVFLSYGPGGLPYNWRGWLISALMLRPLGINMFDTKRFEKVEDKRSWLGEEWNKKRKGDRPTIGPHPVPQRQLDQHASEEMEAAFMSSFLAIAAANPALIAVKPSAYERHTHSLFVADDLPFTALEPGMSREISHIHGTSEYSAHVVLSPRDAQKVIEAGWGQMHMLNGVRVFKKMAGIMVPESYVLLYAPRDQEELDVLIDIIKAGVGFMTGKDRNDIK